MAQKYGIVTTITERLFNGILPRQSEMFAATANLPGFGRMAPIFLTVPNYDVTQNLMLQGLMSYSIGRIFRLPVPETCPVSCKTTLLPTSSKCLIGRDLNSPYLKAVAAVNFNPHHTKQRILIRNQLQKADQQQWRYLPEIAVHDELLCVTDRSDSTLLRTGQNDFTLLDFEPIFGGPPWTPQILEEKLKGSYGNNAIATLIARYGYDIQIRRMLNLAVEYSKNLSLNAENLGHDLGLLAWTDSQTIRFIVDLLNQRAKILGALIQRRVENEQLFHGNN